MNGAVEVYLMQELLRVVPLDHDKITVGRGPFNTINLPHPQVSRQHGLIKLSSSKGMVSYEDLSRYGSVISGIHIKGSETVLKHGDSIEIGHYRLIYNEHSKKRDIVKTELVQSQSALKSNDLRLAIKYPDKTNLSFDLQNNKITVGSHQSNTVIVDISGIPDYVMTFLVMRDGIYLNVDLPDAVYLNGERIKSGLYKINETDRIVFAAHEFSLHCVSINTVKTRMIGSSVAMEQLRQSIEVAALKINDLPVLIQGESGTGKELVARSIHEKSDKNEKPFVAVNCSAIAESLAESLLFGHRAGSFTNATNDHIGYFERADGGTLFLDEIGDLPKLLQAKLLRAIEYQEIYPVGVSQPIKVKVRIISATNKNISLSTTRHKSEFRDDLYYRLSAFEIQTPPLRERVDDIPELIRHYHQELSNFNSEASKVIITKAAILKAKQYSWPGNVRELKNETQKAVLTAHKQVISIPAPKGISSDESDEREREVIRLHKLGKSKLEIMRSLKISRATYFRLLKKP